MQAFGSIRIPLVINGVDGEPGKDGEDAMVYSLVSSSSNLVYYPSRGAYAPQTITLTYYKTEGAAREAVSGFSYNGTVEYSDGTSDVIEGSNVSVITFSPGDYGKVVSAVTIKAHVGSEEDDTTAEFSVRTTHTCQPRTLDWDACVSGFEFQCGALGDMYIDTVTHGGNMYQCVTTHAKGAGGDEPGAGTDSDVYWKAVQWFDTVAMNLLLANYASIKNLVADDVYMETEDGNTAIWINPALAGMLVRKIDSAYTKGRENQNAADWESPTTAFTAQELPDLDSLYKGKDFSGSTGDGEFVVIENASPSDVLDENVQEIGTLALTGVLTVGGTVKLSVDSDIRVTIEDGDSTVYPFSEVVLELRCASSRDKLTVEGVYRVLWVWTADGGGVSGDSVTRARSETAEATFETDSEELHLSLFRTAYIARSASKISVEGSFGVSGSCVTNNYMSRYTAGGAFIGLGPQSYLRVGMNATGEARHTMLAGGNGVDFTVGGCFQYMGGKKLPFCYALFVGDFTPNGNRLSVNYWTFDDSSLSSLDFRSVGRYVFTLPVSWWTTHGFDLSAGKDLCVTVSARGDSDEGAYAVVDDISNGQISVKTYNAVGDLEDVPFSLRIDYFPKNKSASAGHPYEYKEPEVTLLSSFYSEPTGSATYKVYFNVEVKENDASYVYPSYFEINGVKYYVVSEDAVHRDSDGAEIVTSYSVEVPASATSEWGACLYSAYEIHSSEGDVEGYVSSTNTLVWTGSGFRIW